MPGTAAGLPGLMAGYLLKTTAVLIVALLAAAAAKRRPAAFRHFILSSALIALLLLPLLSLAPVGWRSSVLPAWMAVSAPRPADSAKGPAPGRAAKAEQAVWLQAEGQEDSQRSAVGRTGHRISLSSASPAVRPADGQGTPSLPPVTSAAARFGRTAGLGLALAALWSGGLAVLLLRLAFGLAGAARLTAEGTPLDSTAWHVLLKRFIAFVSLRREVRLKSHPGVVVPLTWGFRRPIVLFPEGADAWTDDERSSALYHELSHIKRADFVAMLLVRASLALFWWNPLCWIVYREILKEQEIACDELVLRAGIRPSTYAASLLAFRRSAGFRWSPSAALLGMIGRSSFEGRLAAILKQKLTLMEVKMKTKIMLALALVLAVALIGTARPAAGTGKSAATTTVVEGAAPASLDTVRTSPVSQEVQAEKAVVQEQQKEQEKAKAAEKAKEAEKAAKDKAVAARTIVIKPEGKEGGPIEITITEGNTTKTLVLDKSLTITKGKDGKVLILTPEGKEPIVVEGEPLRLEIKGGGLEIIREGKPVEIGEGGVYRLRKEGGEKGENWVAVEPGREGRTVRIVRKGEGGTAWTIEEPEKGEAVWVAKEVAGEPLLEKRIAGGGRAFAFSSAADRKMLERVQALQEQVQAIKAKKMDITALEESLKTLEAELKANEEKLRTFTYKFDQAPGEVAVTKKFREAEGQTSTWKREREEEAEAAEEKATARATTSVSVRADDTAKGTINLVFTGQDGEAGQAAFERAVVKLKKELPEGYKIVEQKYDADNGSMTFKIAAPEGRKTDKALVERLVELIQEEIKKSTS